MLVRIPPPEWLPVFDYLKGTSLAIGGDPYSLGIIKSGVSNDKKILRDIALNEIKKDGGPQVIVLGHTHQPDRFQTERGIYFNPGSWTRYVDLDKEKNLSLEDLKHEESFPYQLNYVRVEYLGNDKQLLAEMHCYQ